MVLGAVIAFPASAWQPVAPMQAGRVEHTATLLHDGRVLVLGGITDGGNANSLGEIFDPLSGSWSPVPPMAEQRWTHAAVPLLDGRVLVVGGDDSSGSAVHLAELFDPQTNSWSRAGGTDGGHFAATATLMPNGDVVVVGGDVGPVSVERYVVATGQWVSEPPEIDARYIEVTVRLPDGALLTAGGQSLVTGNPIASVERLPPGGPWIDGGALPGGPRRDLSGASLLDGRVIVLGGATNVSSTAVDLFDPRTGWSAAAPLPSGRDNTSLALLPSGDLFVAGGEITATTGTPPLSNSVRYRLPRTAGRRRPP